MWHKAQKRADSDVDPSVYLPSISGILLRWQDSNLRPSGYEPDELPLLHTAINIPAFGTAKIVGSSFFASENPAQCHKRMQKPFIAPVS